MVNESTPLLSETAPNVSNSTNAETIIDSTPFFSPFRRLLTVALILSISFVLTATTLLYSFNMFACEEFYSSNGFEFNRQDGSERCKRPEVEASAASAISIMVTATTISGVLNLLTTSHLIRTRGVKFVSLDCLHRSFTF